MHRLAAVALALAAALPGAAGADVETDEALGRRLFRREATPPCALCHTLKDAAAEGAVGPNLDELRPDAARVATALRNGIGAMQSYAPTLSAGEIAALAHYVSKVAGR